MNQRLEWPQDAQRQCDVVRLRNTAAAFSVKILPCETRRKMKSVQLRAGQARHSSLRAIYPEEIKQL